MRLISSFIIILFLTACAQISTLTGGKTDNYAPAIDSIRSYPKNGALNYSESIVILKFNEYIKLNKASENIVITPQPKIKPTYSVKNKTFELIFNDSLLDNTTYVINFNSAIQDITERNDSVFQYVFSTGNYIDSLSISGIVKDSYTNKAVEKCFIAIYPFKADVNFDSIPYHTKPTYLGQTNKFGQYKVSYLKPEKYIIFAFDDLNKNMLLNPEEEKFGFLSQQYINLDSSLTNINFRLSKIEAATTSLIKSDFVYPGQLTLVFNKPPQKFELNSNVNISHLETNIKDSLVFWIMQKPTKGIEFYFKINNESFDTLLPILKNIPTKNEITNIKLSTNIVSGQLLLPLNPFEITTTEPILKIDTTKFHFLDKDSIPVHINYKISLPSKITFETLNNAQYLQVDSLAIETVFGNFNQNKTNYKFENLIADEYYGLLILTIDSLETPYVFELLDAKNKLIKTFISSLNQTTITFNDLEPGKYQLRAIKDSNYDDKWTSANFKNKTQAESVYYYTDEIKIRSKWDLEIEWNLNE